MISKRAPTCPLRLHGIKSVMCVSVVLAVLTCACDPAVTVDGTVRSADGKPVVGAEVDMRCPNERPRGPILSGDAGAFTFPDLLGCASLDCTVVIRKPTGERAQYPVHSHCRGRRLGCGRQWCNEIHVDARF